MSPAKVTLSPKELELVNNSDWILTKNTVIGKVYTLFGQLSEVYQAELKKHPLLAAMGIDITSAKIAKGEQYEGLPWVMLDHPRHFTSIDTFAIRSFFWWGNYCSITLQLSGRFAEQYRENLSNYFQKNNAEGWYVCCGKDAWQHHFRGDNYQPVEKGALSFETSAFIKLAKKIPLNDWNALTEFYEKSYSEILFMLDRSEV
jgi:hypothetical protein